MNKSARRTTEMFRTTSIVLSNKEAGLRPAKSVLNNRQWRFVKRLVKMPDDYGGGKIVKGESKLAKRLRRCLGVKGKVEENTLLGHNLKADVKVLILEKKKNLKELHVPKDWLPYWTDGSRLEDRRV